MKDAQQRNEERQSKMGSKFRERAMKEAESILMSPIRLEDIETPKEKIDAAATHVANMVTEYPMSTPTMTAEEAYLEGAKDAIRSFQAYMYGRALIQKDEKIDNTWLKFFESACGGETFVCGGEEE